MSRDTDCNLKKERKKDKKKKFPVALPGRPRSRSSSVEVVPADQHRLADQNRDDLTWEPDILAL